MCLGKFFLELLLQQVGQIKLDVAKHRKGRFRTIEQGKVVQIGLNPSCMIILEVSY